MRGKVFACRLWEECLKGVIVCFRIPYRFLSSACIVYRNILFFIDRLILTPV